MIEALAATAAPVRPWLAQPGESQADHARFLLWAFGDRSAPLSSACATAAAQWSWSQRVAVIDHLLNPNPETPQQAVAAVAADALVSLRCEIQWLAARAARQPGSIDTRDVIALLKLASDLGLQAPKPDAQESETWFDPTRLTGDELATFSCLAAKAFRPASERP